MRDDTQDDASQPDRSKADDARLARRRRFLLIGFGALALCAGLSWGAYYLLSARFYESTDDAYTQADNTAISPKVAGYIATLAVTDNQPVARGQLLVKLDDRDYRAALDQAVADVAAADAQLDNADAQIAFQQSQIDQAAADVTSAEANLKFAQENYDRYSKLVTTGAGTVQNAQQADAALRSQKAAVLHNRAVLEAATKQLGVVRAQREQAAAGKQRAEAAREQARLNLDYTTITAPVAGAVGDRSARVGLYVQPGMTVMTVVPMGRDIYVVANFKETQLDRMYRGQRVTLSVDAYPGATLHGTVDSLAPGSGAVFSLLPPENATGNFTKIVQRVPVKILLDDDPVLDRLRPGLSVLADVDVRTTPPGERSTLAAPHTAPAAAPGIAEVPRSRPP